MKRYWTMCCFVLLLLLSVFLLVEGLNVKWLTEPYHTMSTQSIGAAVAGVGLLGVDAILPIPASLIMITNGTLFGVWIGASLSLMGSLCASAIAFAIGRRGTTSLDRFLSPEERWLAEERITRWGILTIVITRPVPLLAETTLLIAGTSQMTWRSMLFATLVGSLPLALIYALAGTMVQGISANAQTWIAAFVLFCLVSGIAYHWLRSRKGEATLWKAKLRKV